MSKDTDDTISKELEQEIDRFFTTIRRMAERTGRPGIAKAATEAAAAAKLKIETHVLSPDLVESLLTSDVAMERIKGRLLATGIGDTFCQFIDHEQERNSNIGGVLMAVNEVAAMMVGSVIVQRAKSSEASAKLADALIAEFARLVIEIVRSGITMREKLREQVRADLTRS